MDNYRGIMLLSILGKLFNFVINNRLKDYLVKEKLISEQQNGFIFIICASGKSAAEMLEALQARLVNDAAQEIQIAATEQAKITRLRLEKLVS